MIMRIAIMGSGGIGGMCGSQSLGAPFSIQVAVQHNSAFPAHYESGF